MFLKPLPLRQFRTFHDQVGEFDAAKTILVGNNAQGKSNLLEAVELLSTLRSHRTSRDRDLIRDGDTIAQIAAQLERVTGTIDLAISLRQNSRRTVYQCTCFGCDEINRISIYGADGSTYRNFIAFASGKRKVSRRFNGFLSR